MSEPKKRPEEILEEMSQGEGVKLLHAPPADDTDMNTYASAYQAAEQAFKRDKHPDVMEIAEFILAEGDVKPDSGSDFFAEIQSHIERCPICREEYLSLKDDLPEFKKPAGQPKPSPVVVNRKKKKLSLKRILYYPVRIAAVFFTGWLAVYSASELSKPEAIRYGTADITQDGVSRALTSETFSETHTLVSEERYDEAISLLLQQITEEPEGTSAFYLHYTAGKLYLLSAQSDILGMFTSYDDKKVALAQKEFLLAIEKNYSGKYENISYDASFYLAKTYILQNNFSKGKELLEYVAGTKGSKSREAAELLSKL
ncbi:MAG: hypothetical protein IT279_13335 [Ignavibacteriaceae bacterium]|nr:hypothetical protein [Ignavibacteriaceae bacterium]